VNKKSAIFSEAKRAFGLFGYILVVWGFYRLLFRFPEEFEELVLKPIIWLSAVGFLLWKEKRDLPSIGWTLKGFWKSLYLGLGLGMAFSIEGIVANVAKYGGIRFVDLGYGNTKFLLSLAISVATAICEETVFRGYILKRLSEASNSKWFGVGVSSVMFVLVHFPIWIFVYAYTPAELTMQSLVSLIFALGNGALFAMTESLVGPVVTHVVWGWAVVLFR